MLGFYPLGTEPLGAITGSDGGGSPGPTIATTVSLAFENRSGVPAANVTGLHVAFFDQSDAASLLAPIATWSSESLDASGLLVLDITGLTSLYVGDTGWLVMSSADKSATFTGPVTVS